MPFLKDKLQEAGEWLDDRQQALGTVATSALNQPSSVRIITVEPDQETSVHYHPMRDEMWVVLHGGPTVEIGNRVVKAQPAEEFMVAAEETHRIGNAGATRGRVLEIVHGYTTEDDRSGSRTRTDGRSRPTRDASSTPGSSGPYTDRPAMHVVCLPRTGSPGACFSKEVMRGLD
jgi:mannose-6-phosphate isomerase